MKYTGEIILDLNLIYPYLKTGLEVIYEYNVRNVTLRNTLQTSEIVYSKTVWKELRNLSLGGGKKYTLKPVLYPRKHILDCLKDIDKNTLNLKDLDKLLCFVDTGDINLLNKLPHDVVMRIYDQQIDIHGLIDNDLALSKFL